MSSYKYVQVTVHSSLFFLLFSHPVWEFFTSVLGVFAPSAGRTVHLPEVRLHSSREETTSLCPAAPSPALCWWQPQSSSCFSQLLQAPSHTAWGRYCTPAENKRAGSFRHHTTSWHFLWSFFYSFLLDRNIFLVSLSFFFYSVKVLLF